MDSAEVTDMILRAVAAMRERGDLPEIEAPHLAVIRERGPSGETYRCDIGPALARALQTPSTARSDETLAILVVTYLQEVVDLVPAYHDIAAVELAPDNSLLLRMRPR